jgi:hypothetical protein
VTATPSPGGATTGGVQFVAHAPSYATLATGAAAGGEGGSQPQQPTTQNLSFLDPTFNAVEGQTFSGPIGTFFNPTSSAPPSAYSATVQWGDGATSTGTVSAAVSLASSASAGLTISGSHLYVDDGSYNVQITVNGPGGQTLLINQTTAQVADAPLTGQAVTYGAKPGTYNDVVGSFTDPNALALPKDFTASIGWGDGSTSVGLVNGQAGRFNVTGRHDLPVGTYPVTVTVQDQGGSTTSWTSTLYIGTRPAGSSLLATDPTVSATEGQLSPFP